MATIHPTKYYCTVSYSQKYYYIIAIYNNNNNSAGMKERCRDGCRTSLLIAGVVLVPAIFHTLLPPCHPYITIHFMEMFFSTCTNMHAHWLHPSILLATRLCGLSPNLKRKASYSDHSVHQSSSYYCCFWLSIGGRFCRLKVHQRPSQKA